MSGKGSKERRLARRTKEREESAVQSGANPPKDPPKPGKVNSKVAPLLPLWLRFRNMVGIAALFTGGGALMWGHFWWGVGLIYLAFVFLGIDFYFEAAWKNNRRIRIALISLVVGASLLFTFGWVLASAPLDLQALDYGLGMPDEDGKVGDIKWKSDYYETRISVQNHTDNDYTNLTISVGTNLNIAHVSRCGKCLDGSIEQGIQMGRVEVQTSSGTARRTNPEGPIHIPVPGKPEQTLNSFGSYSPVWVIKCDKLRRNDGMDFILAVVHFDKKYNLLPPQKPSWVQVNITYESIGHRNRKIGRKIEIH